ncbi:MAG TPA: glycosyltransferase, partial [Ardenticatenaceae bacterium]|nr:glycosyltransferase [Ardenticatenaceae bacterium]
RATDHAIAGVHDAALVLRAKGYTGPLSIIPQFGVDPQQFHPVPREPGRPLTIGYAGRYVEEKGLFVLLDALAGLEGDWRFVARGSGPLAGALAARTAELGLAERVQILPPLPSTEMASFYQAIDLLVLPSLSRPNWKEQFGRVLIEAMACGVPPVGSASGEIPNVIGDAGLIVAEGDPAALRGALAHLMADSAYRQHLGQRGRQRVLAQFTQAQIARRTWDVYRQVLGVKS